MNINLVVKRSYQSLRSFQDDTLSRHWPQTVLFLITLFFFRNFLFGDKMIFGQDVIGLNYPVEQFTTDVFKSGQWPLWNPYAASGYPFLVFSSVFYPLNIIFRILPTYLAFNWTYFLHFLIAGLGMFYLLRHFKLSKLASFFGAIVFEFGGFFSVRMYAGHYMLVQSVAWFPLVLIFVDKLSEASFAFTQSRQHKEHNPRVKNYSLASMIRIIEARFIFLLKKSGKIFLSPLNIIGLSAFLSMVILPGHPQPIFYLGYGLIIYVLTKWAVKIFLEKYSLKSSVISLINLFAPLAAALILTVLVVSPMLIPSLGALKTSLRQGQIDYGSATSYSLSPKKLLLFLTPFYFGSYVTNDYHGGTIFQEMVYYLGVIPLLLAVFVGLNFILLMVKIRTQKNKKTKKQKNKNVEIKNWKLEIGNFEKIFPFLVLSLYAFFIAFGALNPLYKLIYFYLPGFGSLRAPARALMIFSFFGAVLAAFGFAEIFKDGSRQLARPVLKILPLIALVITILDLFLFSSKFLVASDPNTYFVRDELVQFLQKNTKDDFGRVWLLPNTLLSNRGSIFKFFDVQSDVPITVGWYSKLIDAFKARDRNLNQAKERAVIHVNNGKLLSLLGVKYLVSKDGIGDSEELRLVANPKIKIFGDFDKRLPSILEKDVSVYERRHYLPRVKLYDEVKIANNEEEAITELIKDDFDEFKTVIVETSGSVESYLRNLTKTSDKTSTAKIISYSINEIVIETNSSNPKFLLLNDIYYPGWKAYVDNQEVEVYKSNLAFRGVIVPQGKHNVKFVYRPYQVISSLMIDKISTKFKAPSSK